MPVEKISTVMSSVPDGSAPISETANRFLFQITVFCAKFYGVILWALIAYWITDRRSTNNIDEFQGLRNSIVALYFTYFIFVNFVHWLEIKLLTIKGDANQSTLDVPRFIKTTSVYAIKYNGALSSIIFAILLLLSTFPILREPVFVVSSRIFGVLLIVLGFVQLFLSKYPLSYGAKIPASGEFWGAWDHLDEERSKKLPADQRGVSGSSTVNVGSDPEYAPRTQAIKPRLNFSGIFGMQAVKDKLLEPARHVLETRQQGVESPGNGILLHGAPGNGKTVFAEALAGQLGIPFIQMTYGDVSSKWLGETPRVIASTFAYARQSAPCVLFIDEIDSFIRSRDSYTVNSEDPKVTNTLLTEIVNLRSHRVVLIGATNYLSRLDAAAIREGRFDYKVEITAPDEEARIGLLKHGVQKHAPNLEMDAAALESVARRWAGFSVSRLLAVVKALPTYAKEQGLAQIGYNDWMGALREVQGRNGRVPKDTKGIQDLVLQTATREALNLVASRLKDSHRIEQLGGTLPSGVLFYGPSGTGKTAAARALAKEAGWAFLSVAGPDLTADRDRLQKLYNEATDIRPTLIFIDEADDVLRNRQYSSTPEVCNKLLVLMDGTEEKVKDVVFIAATNNPDQIDPALLRAGRFTEKVEFTTPPQSEIPRFIAGWLKSKATGLMPGVDVFDVATLLEGQTIANIEGALQYALNRAISNHNGNTAPMLGLEDLAAAVSVVLANDEG